jgi:hypothetical protein
LQFRHIVAVSALIYKKSGLPTHRPSGSTNRNTSCKHKPRGRRGEATLTPGGVSFATNLQCEGRLSCHGEGGAKAFVWTERRGATWRGVFSQNAQRCKTQRLRFDTSLRENQRALCQTEVVMVGVGGDESVCQEGRVEAARKMFVATPTRSPPLFSPQETRDRTAIV